MAGAASQQNIRKAGNTTLTHTLFNQSPNPTTGTANIESDPRFIDPENGDYRLLPGSPALDAGSNQSWQETAVDFDGEPRRIGTVDLGPFEAAAANTGPFRANFTENLRRGETELEVVFTAHVAGANTNDLTYWWDFGDGSSLVTTDRTVVTNTYAAGIYSVALAVTNALDEGSSISREAHVLVSPLDFYVSNTGGGILPYDNWADATDDIRWVVDNARGNDHVYIAGGDYKLMFPLIWREATGAEIRGGYQGTSASTLGPVDPALWPTVIRRDPKRKVLRVMTIRNVTNGVLTGVTLQDGFCNREYGRFPGGGLGIYDSSDLVISNCIVRNNTAVFPGEGDDISMGGGGIYSKNSSGLLTHGQITGNHIQESWYDHILKGGGMQIEGGTWRIEHCEFVDNLNGSVSSDVLRTKIQGGGLYVNAATVNLIQCILADNMYIYAPSGKLGGGIYLASGALSITNATLATNSISGVHVAAGTAKIAHSILWDNGKDIVGTADLTYCNTRDGVAGVGNMSADPLFADVPLDYHLKSRVGRWTPAGWVKDHEHSPCIDAGPRGELADDEPQPNGARLNLGAYGGTEQASMSLVLGTVFIIR